MTVALSSERERFVQRCVREARFNTAEAVVEAALRLYETKSDDGGLKRDVSLGLEQAMAGRCGTVSADDLWWRVRQR